MRFAVCLIAVAAVLAAPATASAPTLNGLQRQVAALRAQIVVLQTAQSTLGTNDQVTRDWATCFRAQSADLTNYVWQSHVLLAQYVGLLAGNPFPPQPDLPRYDDGGACQRVGQTRIR